VVVDAFHVVPSVNGRIGDERLLAGIATDDADGPPFVRLERALARAILAGVLPVGARLPSEEVIAAHWGLSRQTVHKAVAQLAQEGLVVRRRRAGTFVASGRRERFVLPIDDIRDIVTATGHLYEHRIVERREVHNGADGTYWPDVAEGVPLLRIDCVHSGDGSPIQLERRLINLEVVPGARDESFEDVPSGFWLCRHVPWSSAVQTVRAVNATAEIAGRLGIEPGAACLVVERRTVHLGRPVTLVHLTSVGSRLTLTGGSVTTITSELNRFVPPERREG
jgi:GntR family histidine utilization transcriptional repressor